VFNTAYTDGTPFANAAEVTISGTFSDGSDLIVSLTPEPE